MYLSLASIASVSVRKAIGDHDEHRADLYCQKGYTPLLREGSHQQNKDGNNAAHCTQDHHDVFLMRLQKSDQSICQTKCLLLNQKDLINNLIGKLSTSIDNWSSAIRTEM